MKTERNHLGPLKFLATATKAEKGVALYFPTPSWGVRAEISYRCTMTLSNTRGQRSRAYGIDRPTGLGRLLSLTPAAY